LPINDQENFQSEKSRKKSELWLNQIGIFSREDLEKIGSIETYRLLKQRGLPVSLNLVYAIEAMLIDEHWTELPKNLKAELKETVKNL
jgi:DNA transformation protein and related proteins